VETAIPAARLRSAPERVQHSPRRRDGRLPQADRDRRVDAINRISRRQA